MSRVYFIEAGKRGPIKISTSTDVVARLFDLQAGSPKRLSLIATLPGDSAHERELHHHFKSERIHREWFRGNGEVRNLAELVRANPNMEPPRFAPPALPRKAGKRGERVEQRRYTVEELRAMFYVGEGSDIYRSDEAEEELRRIGERQASWSRRFVGR